MASQEEDPDLHEAIQRSLEEKNINDTMLVEALARSRETHDSEIARSMQRAQLEMFEQHLYADASQSTEEEVTHHQSDVRAPTELGWQQVQSKHTPSRSSGPRSPQIPTTRTPPSHRSPSLTTTQTTHRHTKPVDVQGQFSFQSSFHVSPQPPFQFGASSTGSRQDRRAGQDTAGGGLQSAQRTRVNPFDNYPSNNAVKGRGRALSRGHPNSPGRVARGAAEAVLNVSDSNPSHVQHSGPSSFPTSPIRSSSGSARHSTPMNRHEQFHQRGKVPHPDVADVEEHLKRLFGAGTFSGGAGASSARANPRDGAQVGQSNRPIAREPQVVIDGQNVARHYGHNQFVTRGLQIVLDYYFRKGVPAVALLPRHYVDMRPGNSRTADDIPLLLSLEVIGRVCFVPAGTHDDFFILKYAMQKNIDIISNDRFEKEITGQETPEQADRLKNFLRQHLIPFMFVHDDFIPNPDGANIGSSKHHSRSARNHHHRKH